ncbi:MAG TPA: hypothetical protein VMT16_01350, partial [Thermoanaerobaculia bacterium]|nr:hypothetical protein [Thermoanaerobaculia bacterium]
ERGFEPRNGARYLRRAVEREVGSRLAELLVRGEARRGDVLAVEVVEGALRVRPRNDVVDSPGEEAAHRQSLAVARSRNASTW